MMGIPSTTINGSPPAVIEAIPLTRMAAPEPAKPDVWVTCTPAARPCKAASKELVGTDISSSLPTLAIDPVTSLLF